MLSPEPLEGPRTLRAWKYHQALLEIFLEAGHGRNAPSSLPLTVIQNKPDLGQDLSLASLAGFSLSLDIVNTGTFSVLLHRLGFKFKS